MQLYRLAWLVWIVGSLFIVMSWTGIVSGETGWIGFAIAGVGVAISAVPHYRMRKTGRRPVRPDGVPVNAETPLAPGAAVLAYSDGHWWRARVVDVEDGQMVRVDFPTWNAGWQLRLERRDLQLDVHTDGVSAP